MNLVASHFTSSNFIFKQCLKMILLRTQVISSERERERERESHIPFKKEMKAREYGLQFAVYLMKKCCFLQKLHEFKDECKNTSF